MPSQQIEIVALYCYGVNSFIVIISTKLVHFCYSIDQQNTLFEGIYKYSLLTSLGVFKKQM